MKFHESIALNKMKINEPLKYKWKTQITWAHFFPSYLLFCLIALSIVPCRNCKFVKKFVWLWCFDQIFFFIPLKCKMKWHKQLNPICQLSVHTSIKFIFKATIIFSRWSNRKSHLMKWRINISSLTKHSSTI